MDNDPPDPGGTQVGGYVCGTPPNGYSSVDLEKVPNKRPRPSSPVPKNNVPVSPQNDKLTYMKPEFLNKRRYSLSDSPPYVVHVSKSDPTNSNNAQIRPMEFGRYLFQNNFTTVSLGGVKRIGRNRVSVEFKNSDDANSFLESSTLVDAGFIVSVPSFNVSRMGIVRNVALDIDMNEFVSNCVTPTGYGDVIKARRMCRKSIDPNSGTAWIPTQTVVVTFKGQKLPPHVYLFYTSLPVELYKLPTIQCNRCCRFGHTKTICRSDPRCYKCSQPHEGDTCNISVATCLFCSGPHAANHQNCPEFTRQKEIKNIMSQENISYAEASARFPNVRKSFTDVVATPTTTPSRSRQTPPSPLTTISYRKTVSTPRRRIPTPQPGYDRHTHQSIIQNPTPETRNGSAFPDNSLSMNDNFPELLSSLLLNLLTRFSDTGMGISDNLRENLSKLVQITNINQTDNGSTDHYAMELS